MSHTVQTRATGHTPDPESRTHTRPGPQDLVLALLVCVWSGSSTVRDDAFCSVLLCIGRSCCTASELRHHRLGRLDFGYLDELAVLSLLWELWVLEKFCPGQKFFSL